METQYFAVLILVVLFAFWRLLQAKDPHKNLPPSPPSLPIIGHLHLLRRPIHVTIEKLLHKCGPILFLQFGSRPVVIISSPTAIKECFTKNDTIFASRPRLLQGKHLNYNYTSIPMAPYGDLWRNLRRFTSTEIFSANCLQISSNIRQEEASVVIRELFKASDGKFTKVELKSIFCKLMFNIVMRILGIEPYFINDEMVDPDKATDKMDELQNIFLMVPNFGLGDFFPFLKWVDHWGAEKIMLKQSKSRDRFMQDMIEEVRSRRFSSSSCSSTSTNSSLKGEGNRKMIIDILLSLQATEPELYTDDIIKGIILVMFTAGTDTSASTMEWAMSLLLNHPELLNKARDEIQHKVGQDWLLKESDLVELPYLNCIIKETLRVCSLAPHLPPHESLEDCTIEGYDIPKGAMLMVNQVVLHNDPKLWPEPTMFKPERFKESNRENEGFTWIPFGLGRRGCPGEGLAMRIVGLTLGLLIQCFEWELVKGEKIDMSKETDQIIMSKAKPLEAMYRPRPTMLDVLSHL